MAGTYALRGPSGTIYMLNREEVERLIGEPSHSSDPPWSLTNVVTHKSVRVSSKRRLTARDIARISNEAPGRGRRRAGGYHSHPAHPSSHPVATKHRRR